MSGTNPYQGKVRVRICGVLIENRQILLVKHLGLGPAGYFWSPPGGGIEFGESHGQTLQREFREETGLEITASDFIAFHEHIDDRFHALELFFKADKTGGLLRIGAEPESPESGPFLDEIRWFSWPELKQIPEICRHSLCEQFLLEHSGD